MEEIIKIDNRLTKVETKLENVEKKVDTLDAKVEAGHTETEKQIGSLVVCVKEFIATQTKTNEINEKFIDEDKKNTEKQVEKFTTEIKDLHTQINKLKVGILLRAFGLIAFVISTGLLVWQIVKK